MEDFAKKYWEDFEELSVDILKLIFKEYKEKDIKKTKGRKDGGYDAYVLISDSKQNAYKAISESKLRKLSNKDLPLSDFAKTLIISINLCANKVYIFTNLHFSIETQNRLSKFSRGTNIDVQLFDINKICDWIPQLQKASLQKYPENFISQLQKSVVDHPDNILFESEGIINQIEIYDLLGKEKQQKLNEALKQLERKTGIYIVRGRQGSGKTVFINNLVTKLNPQEYNYIDISTITDINDLFIELLSIIWHVDSLIISQFSFEDIENISDYMIDEADKQNLCVTLSKILVKENLVEIESNRLQALLIQYLYKIYTPILKHKCVILVFQNMEFCSSVMLDFIFKFIKKFSQSSILIILELRDEHIVMQKFIKQCENEIKIIGSTKINDLSPTDTQIYIKRKFQLTSQEQKILAKNCPKVPLYIDQIVYLLKKEDIKYDILKDREYFFKYMYENGKYINGANESYIIKILEDFSDEARICVLMISFLDGKINYSDFNTIWRDFKHVEKILDELQNSKLFIVDIDNIKIYHVSILNTLQEIANSDYKKYAIEAYKILWDKIDFFNETSQRIELKKLNLAIELQKIDFIKENGINIIETYLYMEEYETAILLVKKIYDKYIDKLDVSIQKRVLLDLLQCYVCIDKFDDEIEICIDELESYHMDTKFTRDFLFWKSRFYLATGQYKALITVLKDYISKDPKLYYMYALGIKHIYGIDECINSLVKAMKLFPDAWMLQYSYYDHQLSRALKSNPINAQKFIDQIEKFTVKLSLEASYHFQYNKLFVLFYNKQLSSPEKIEQLRIDCYLNNLLVEESRVCNLLGQYYWVQQDIENAIRYFKRGQFLQLETNHRTYWWISSINLILLFAEEHRVDECLSTAWLIINEYRKNNWEKIIDFFSKKGINSNQIIQDKEIVSFLLLLRTLYTTHNVEIFQEIVNEISRKCTGGLCTHYFVPQNLVALFKKEILETSYFFEGHYMIKC